MTDGCALWCIEFADYIYLNQLEVIKSITRKRSRGINFLQTILKNVINRKYFWILSSLHSLEERVNFTLSITSLLMIDLQIVDTIIDELRRHRLEIVVRQGIISFML